MWGTAADLYRIGSTILRTKEPIEKYNEIAEDLSDEIMVLPYGHVTGKMPTTTSTSTSAT